MMSSLNPYALMEKDIFASLVPFPGNLEKVLMYFLVCIHEHSLLSHYSGYMTAFPPCYLIAG